MHPQRPSPLELLRIADKIGCYTARTSYARHRTTSIQIGRNHRPPCRNEATYEPQRLLPAQHHPAIARTKQQAQRQHDPIRSTKLGCRSAHRAYRYYRQRMFHAQIGLYFIGKELSYCRVLGDDHGSWRSDIGFLSDIDCCTKKCEDGDVYRDIRRRHRLGFYNR